MDYQVSRHRTSLIQHTRLSFSDWGCFILEFDTLKSHLSLLTVSAQAPGLKLTHIHPILEMIFPLYELWRSPFIRRQLYVGNNRISNDKAITSLFRQSFRQFCNFLFQYLLLLLLPGANQIRSKFCI